MRNFTGAIKPLHQYPRIVWNGTTVDFDDPISQRDPEHVPAAGSNVSTSGIREVLFERMEYYCTITTPLLYEEKAAQVERLQREWLGRGEQAEVYIDRTHRACWGFDDDTVEDNNHGNPFRRGYGLTSDGFTFSDLAIGRGVNVPTVGTCRARLVSELAGGSANFFFQTGAGTLAFAFKPDYASDDAADHVLLDAWLDTDLGRNRLMVWKRIDNKLHIAYTDQNRAVTILEANVTTGQALKWTANTEHVLLIQWGTTSDFAASLDGTAITTKRYPITAGGGLVADGSHTAGETSGTPLGSETVMNASPTMLSLGQDFSGQMPRGTGSVGLLSLFAVVYSPALPASLGAYSMPWRTYIPKGELISAGFGPQRATSGKNYMRYQMRIRDGR